MFAQKGVSDVLTSQLQNPNSTKIPKIISIVTSVDTLFFKDFYRFFILKNISKYIQKHLQILNLQDFSRSHLKFNHFTINNIEYYTNQTIFRMTNFPYKSSKIQLQLTPVSHSSTEISN